METTEQILNRCIANSKSRLELWIELLKQLRVVAMAEIGVYRGDFAAGLLKNCDSLKRYYMIDPWRHLEDWNKPANVDSNLFEQFFIETKAKTDFANNKRVILRGKTTEVINEIPGGNLDFIYIDSDHTLKGIAIDLINSYPKIRNGRYIGGDDFSSTIWQHQTRYEPTLVFPFAVYFVEMMGAPIYSLPSSFLT